MNMDQDRQMLMVEGNVRNQIVLNVVQNPAWAEVNGNGINKNQIRCYNCQGVDRYARNCIIKPRKRDAAYLQTQLQIAQKEEAWIQLNFEEFDFMAAARAYDEIEEVNANYSLKDNLQQASTSDTQTDNAPVYDSDGSAECGTKWGTVEQNTATLEETRAYFESLYNNLVIEVEKVNTVNRKVKETNVDLTTKLARYKNQEKCFEINQEKYDKLERCYQKSVYQEQCLTEKINALHLSSTKMIMTLNEEIANLNNQLSKEKSTVSSLQEEKKKLKFDFKIRKDELVDKQIQLENKIKELDNILKMALGYRNPFYLNQAQQKQQSLYNDKVLLQKYDPPAVYDSEETLQLAQESRLKMKQLNKEIKRSNYAKINQLSGVFVSQKAKSREELYFLNTSKTATISKSISIPNEEFSDDTSLSVAQKFLNEIKSTIVTLQQAAKFVRDFKSLAKEAYESLAKHKTLEFEIERLLRAVVSQDIMSIVQSNSILDTSNLQTELDCMKEKLENCIIKKEKEYAVLWNNWYPKCEECKYDKISYDKVYNDMQQKIKQLQAQLGDQKGKSKDTPCVSDTLDSLSQKLENENVELEFQLGAQLFDKVFEQKDTTKGTSMNTKFANQSTKRKPSLQSLRNNFVVRQPNAFQSERPKFSKSRVPLKVVESNDLSNPVTSNSEPFSRKSTVVNNERVIAPRIFRINPFKAYRVDNFVPKNM
ncbi:hypothetical protein Tco_0469255 [Tanacetum coccineum]